MIDYSVPFFYSGVSCLSFNRVQAETVPLTGFLVPFSTHLWFSIFALLLATACAAAVFEWLSPFGLNPWGRQRSKNFTFASAAWALPSLMFGHLIAFKAPKCWPNKARDGSFPPLLPPSPVLLCPNLLLRISNRSVFFYL